MASRPFQFLEKKRSKIRKRASKHFEGLAALSTHSAGQRAEVKAGCKPVHFSLETLHKTGLFSDISQMFRMMVFSVQYTQLIHATMIGLQHCKI